MGFYSRLSNAKSFLRKIGMNPAHFLWPVSIFLLASFFEGLSAWLLIPIAKGVVKMDFVFVRGMPLFKNIIDAYPGIFTGNTPIFILLVLFAFMAAVTKNFLIYISTLSVSYQAIKFTRNLREAIFTRYLSFGKLFFDKTSQGYLQNLLLGFTNTITQRLREMNILLSQIFMLLVYIVMLFLISWKLTIFIIIFFPVLHYTLRFLINKIRKASLKYADYQNKLSKKIFDILICMPLVKAYAQEEREKEHFNLINIQVSQLEFSINKKWNLVQPLQECIMLLMFLLFVSAVAFIVVKERTVEIANFLVYFYILRRGMISFNSFNNLRASLAGIYGPIQKILEVFDDSEKYFIPGGKKEFSNLERQVEFNHLNFSYQQGLEVLKDISFNIEKGKITAIVGPTGAGKTTLVSLLMRFYDVSPKSILIDGTDIRDFTLESLRRHAALVSQETLLFDDTIKANIIYGLDAVSDAELIEIAKKARLYDYVMSLPEQFNSLIGDRGTKLSGGEKQRLSIARALLKGSEVLILDEATSSLDSKTEKLIQEAMEEAFLNKTVIVIAHRLSTIKNADKVVVIEDGRLVEEGFLEELLNRKGKFFSYWQEQKFY